MKTFKLFASLVVAGGLALGAVSMPVQAEPAKTTQPAPDATQGHKKDGMKKDKDKGTNSEASAKIGQPAPAFELTDTDGKTVKLEDYKGKVVVLEWYNPECPFIVKHHKTNKTFNTLNTEYSSKGVVFLAINSSAKGMEGAGKELNAKMKKEFGLEYPVLLDEAGTVGRAYGAQRTPQVFVIDKAGTLAYKGAIDNNDDRSKAGDKNYVKAALDEILAGKPVSNAETKPYGCSVKYAKN